MTACSSGARHGEGALPIGVHETLPTHVQTAWPATGGRRGGVDDDPTLAVLSRRSPRHGGRAPCEDIERPDHVDLLNLLEGRTIVRDAVAVDHTTDARDPGAVDHHSQMAFGQGAVDGLLAVVRPEEAQLRVQGGDVADVVVPARLPLRAPFGPLGCRAGSRRSTTRRRVSSTTGSPAATGS